MDSLNHMSAKILGLAQKYITRFCCSSLKFWSHRLTVRTPGFHPGNPGSIPGEITIEKASGMMPGAFSMA